jgi:2-dehydro-3-deoxyphosphogluconate aldolase/(4S)-4-hydroxy-2-oxoglutarate aldolase
VSVSVRQSAAVATLARLEAARAIAVLRARDSAEAVSVAEALAEGGLQAIELTFTTPGAADALAEARRLLPPHVLLGAGTITTRAELEAALDAGADFLVSPHLDPVLLKSMLASGRLALPGVLTPTEVAAALRAGTRAVKLFPAGTAGVAYMRSLFGPFPELRVVPTGGISIAGAREWLDAGAAAVGLGGELVPRALLDAGAWGEIARNASALAAGVGGVT